MKFGKIDNSTELIVTPFEDKTQTRQNSSNKSQLNVTNRSTSKKELSPNSLYQRLFNKESNVKQLPSKQNHAETIIDSRTLDNVSEKSSMDTDSSESTESSETVNSEGKTYRRKSKQRFISEIRSFETLLAEISRQDRRIFNFRAIPRVWSNSEMCDVYVSKPIQHGLQTIYALNYDSVMENDERISREYFVNLKIDADIKKNSKNSSTTIELNDILMAKLKISKFSRITLSNKNTVLNFLEKIELIPTPNCKFSKQEIIEDFRRMLVETTRLSPLLINQDQIFKLCGDTVLVTAKIFPESFRYCLCDAELLRERKFFISDQVKDLKTITKAAEEISSPSSKLADLERNYSFINTKELANIIQDCVKSITIKNCLNETNRLRKFGNFLVLGK